MLNVFNSDLNRNRLFLTLWSLNANVQKEYFNVGGM